MAIYVPTSESLYASLRSEDNIRAAKLKKKKWTVLVRANKN